MTVDRPLQQLANIADVRSDTWVEARAGWSSTGPGRYGAGGRGRWPLLALVIVAHLIGLALLASAVIRPVKAPKPQPLRITLVPLERSPPPAAAPRPAAKPAATQPTPPPVIAAAPIVSSVAPAPVMIAPAPVIAPPAPEPAPTAVAPAPAAAPLIPPDGQAATLHNPAPAYPMEARRRHQQGTVRLRVTISVDGRVQEIAVARTSGFDLLDQAALEAVRRWKFVPGSRAGVPVEAVGSLAIPFKLV